MTEAATSSIDPSFANLRIRRLAGRIGGEVQDFKLSAGLDDRSNT